MIGCLEQRNTKLFQIFSRCRRTSPKSLSIRFFTRIEHDLNFCYINFKDMFTLYRIDFCSVSKVAPVQCKQKLTFCCDAEIVPKRSQCGQKPCPSYNLQRSLLIWKDHLPIRGSVAISAPIKVLDLTRAVSKTYPIWNVPLPAAEQSCTVCTVPEQKLLRKQHFLCEQKPYPVHFLQPSVSLSGTVWATPKLSRLISLTIQGIYKACFGFILIGNNYFPVKQ